MNATTPTVASRDEFLSGRPVAKAMFDALAELNGEGVKPNGYDLITAVYKPPVTAGERSSGYEILRTLSAEKFIELVPWAGSIGWQIVALEEA